jgi:hypothetical protein
MKKIIALLILLACTLALNSCGVGSALVLNQNQNTTHVQLGSNNLRIIDRITGSAEVEYILLIGGMKQNQVYENAYAAMMAKADLKGGSRAIINIVTEEHVGGFIPFYHRRKVTVSAHVIEFTK